MRRRHLLPGIVRQLFTRRDFLKRAGLVSAAVTVLPLLPACGSSSNAVAARPAEREVSFQHGVASGDPLQDRVILWTRVTPAIAQVVIGQLKVASDAALQQIVAITPFTTDASRDYTVKIDQAGLRSGTTYYYQFTVGAVTSPVGRTRTLVAGNLAHLRLGVAVCASLAHGYFNAYARLAERSDLDAVLHLGDYIYEYASDPASGDEVYGTVRTYEPTHEIRTLADYRMRHGQYKREPELQAMHGQHPVIAIWDDHEFADNAYADGAVNHQPDRDGVWADRVKAALQAYYEWMPIRVQDASDLRKNYRAFSFGNLVDLFMLEERVGNRAKQLDPNGPSVAGFGTFTQTGDFADAGRQLLGTVEEQWLFDKLRNSQAKWKLIGQGVMVAQLKVLGLPDATNLSEFLNSDQWDGYEPARDRLFSVLQGDATHPAVGNVVVLTGDIHTSWAADLTPDPNNALVYNPVTGSGSLAVEFVCTSVTSPGLEQLAQAANALRLNNPHFKYIDLAQKGYMVFDITPERTLGEWWYTGAAATRQADNTLGAAFAVMDGSNRLVSG